MSDASTPLVSVITVTYNAQDTIVPTMVSVARQTATDYEHIIMDGASADRTLSLADEHATQHTRIISSPDLGIYDAMNKALGAANGRYVLFLNSGDSFADANALEKYISAAKRNDYPGVVYGQTVLVDGHGNILGPRHLVAPQELTYESFRDGMVVCHQAFMALRKIAPLYNTNKFRYSADYEWCLLCLQHSRANVYVGDEPVIHYLKEGLTTRNHRASLIERFKIMCHYYGVLPTVVRHLAFAGRYVCRQLNGKASNIQ